VWRSSCWRRLPGVRCSGLDWASEGRPAPRRPPGSTPRSLPRPRAARAENPNVGLRQRRSTRRGGVTGRPAADPRLEFPGSA
jgi:hypothetical protein